MDHPNRAQPKVAGAPGIATYIEEGGSWSQAAGAKP